MALKKLYALATIAALAAALPVLAQKAALKQDGTPDTVKRDPSRVQAINLDGGPVEKVYTATNNEPTVIGEDPNFQPVPGMIRKFQVGCAGALLAVTFSAETQLRGDAGDFDWIEVEVRLDGAPMQPHDPISPTAYSGNENYTMSRRNLRAAGRPGTAHRGGRLEGGRQPGEQQPERLDRRHHPADPAEPDCGARRACEPIRGRRAPRQPATRNAQSA